MCWPARLVGKALGWGSAVPPTHHQERDAFFPLPLRSWEEKGSHSRKQRPCAVGPPGTGEWGGLP